ncbi:MAG: DUF6465 family protein [Eubacteriales bacterium]|nr:DUF6465 family protein [Eubacteriales bacterium]
MATKKTDAAKKAVKDEVKKTTKAVKETAAKTEKAVKEEAKSTAKAVKETAAKAEKTVKEAAKKTEKKVEKKVEKAVEKAEKKTEKKAAAPKKSAKKSAPQVYFEFAGKQIDPAKVVEDVKAAYVAGGNKESAISSVKVYVKAEDSAAYFVINDKDTGKIVL